MSNRAVFQSGALSLELAFYEDDRYNIKLLDGRIVQLEVEDEYVIPVEDLVDLYRFLKVNGHPL